MWKTIPGQSFALCIDMNAFICLCVCLSRSFLLSVSFSLIDVRPSSVCLISIFLSLCICLFCCQYRPLCSLSLALYLSISIFICLPFLNLYLSMSACLFLCLALNYLALCLFYVALSDHFPSSCVMCIIITINCLICIT